MFKPTRSTLAALATAAVCFAAALAQAQTSTQAEVPMPPQAAVCAACHGPGGRSTDPLVPALAAQTSRYIYLQLRDFQEGRRDDPRMTPMVTGLSRDDMRALANYFAAQKPVNSSFKPDAAKALLGKVKADETLCTMCHLGGFLGQNEIPRVAGQSYEYIVKQLSDFKARKRTNDAGNMTSVSNTLNEKDIENLAHYLAGL